MISFHNHHVDFDFDEGLLTDTITKLVCNEGKLLDDVSIILCSDEFLLELNRNHLGHDYYTDILTFDYGQDSFLKGELYISIDRVIDNSLVCNTTEIQEFARVVVHGFLHLCGYKDLLESEKLVMTNKENLYLSPIYL